ncbi:Phosphoglucomutase [subsurface metagenome]
MNFIAGAEESYGYLAGDFVRDKDAVMACALIAETAVWAKNQGKSLFELLLDIYREFGLYHENLISIYKKGKSGGETIAKMMEDFRSAPPVLMAGSKVKLVHDYLSGKSLDMITGEKSDIELPASNVLQYITEDQTKVSIRPSGTEPKIKFYFSVKGSFKNTDTYNESRKILEEKIELIKKDLGI